MRRLNRSWLLAVGALASVTSASLSGGCSAIVDPNTNRLGDPQDAFGGPDTGTRIDTGTPVDTGMPTPDAGTDAPGCPADCSDGIACTDDACDGVRCTHTANDTLCPGQRCNVGSGCVPRQCVTAADCDDHNVCNGEETCVPGSSPTGCMPGAVSLRCDDSIPCTIDSCDMTTGCTHVADNTACNDGIACTTETCSLTLGCQPSGLDDAMCNIGCTSGAMCTPRGCAGGNTSCDDMSPCTADRCESMTCLHDPIDADGDGTPASFVRVGGGMVACPGTDCNDGNAGIEPDAMELCNGIDDNCNMRTDEGCMVPTGESCADPIPLMLSGGGTVSVGGTLDAMRTDDYTTTCGRAGGRDLVYAVTLDRTVDVRIETTGGVDTVLGVGTTCDLGAFARQCNDDQNSGTSANSRIWLRRVNVPAGSSVRLFILVDGFDGAATSSGAFTLNVTTTTPLGDACGGTTLNVTGGGTVYGNINGIAGAQQGSCQPGIAISPEALFRFEGPRVESLIASSSDFVPTLHARTTCFRPDSQVSCTNGTSTTPPGGTVTASPMASSGPLFIFLDNGTMGGAYRLEVNP